MNCFVGLFYEAFFVVNYGNVAQVKSETISFVFEERKTNILVVNIVSHCKRNSFEIYWTNRSLYIQTNEKESIGKK